jgi:hypothetical protein
MNYHLGVFLFLPALTVVATLLVLYLVIRVAVRAGIEDAWNRRQKREGQI